MTSSGDTSDHVREPQPRRSARRIEPMPPSTFDLLVQVTLDSQHLRGSDPALQREADLAQCAARETAQMLACDPDLHLEAELAAPRMLDESLEVELDLYFAFDAELEVDMLVIYGDTDDLLDDPWFSSFDPDAPDFDPDSLN